MKRLLLLLIPALGGCAPRALYFHETTKVAFAADYNVSDSQPLASSLGYKRRIVAVVPAQERISGDRGERNAINKGEALSLVSKFRVRSGSFAEGVTIVNRFASGVAARTMTHSDGSSASLNALLHGDPVVVEQPGPVDGGGPPVRSTGVAVNERINAIMGKFVPEDTSGPTGGRADFGPDGKPRIRPRPTPKPPPSPRDTSEGAANELKNARQKVIKDPVTGEFKIVPIDNPPSPDADPAAPVKPANEGAANELKAAGKKVVKDPVTGKFKIVPLRTPPPGSNP